VVFSQDSPLPGQALGKETLRLLPALEVRAGQCVIVHVGQRGRVFLAEGEPGNPFCQFGTGRLQGGPGFFVGRQHFGKAADIALEQGEVEGFFTVEDSFANHEDMFRNGTVLPILQTRPEHPGLALVQDVLPASDRKLLALVLALDDFGLPLIGPPGVPDSVTRVLRQSYLNMVASKEYQDEAIKRGLDVGQPNTGEELARFVAAKLTSFPADVIEEYRRYVEHN